MMDWKKIIFWGNVISPFIYAVFNFYLSFSQCSYWYLALGVFFLTIWLGKLMARLRKGNSCHLMKIVSVLLVFLAVTIAGISYMTINEKINPVRNMIFVIAQAAFTFTFISMAIYNIFVSYKKKDNWLIMDRNMSLASAIGSMLSLERMMLGTFGNAEDSFNTIMEACSGMGAFLILLVLAYNLYRVSKEKRD